MKIIFNMSSMNKGGAERVVSNLSNYFANTNEVIIISTSNSDSEYELNEKIKYIKLDNKKKSKLFFLKNVKRIFKLRKILKIQKPDIVVSMLPNPTYRLMVAKVFLNVKTIISVRNDPNKEYNNFFKKILTKFLYSKANGFIFQTPDAQKWFPDKIQQKSTVIPNPINEKFIGEPFKGTREKTIVTVGRLTEQKNHQLLIDAFSEVSKKHDDYTLKIYGEGNLKDKLTAQIDSLNLTDKVKLMGQTDNVKEAIYKAGMFVLSSDYEGMPNALMEAMALGIPSISTDCPIGGPKFLIKNNENGILFPVKDKNSLVKAINTLIEDREFAKKIGQEANKICDSLNPQKINKTWEEYIKQIIAK